MTDEQRAPDSIVPPEVRELIVTLAQEVFVFDFTPMIIRDITRALCDAAGIARPEIFEPEILEDDPDTGEK